MEEKHQVYHLSSVDKVPQRLKTFPPEYPLSAKEEYVSGKVIARFIVTKEGKTKDISIIESDPPGVFDENVLAAIKEYRFMPGYKNGVPVDVVVSLPIRFELDD